MNDDSAAMVDSLGTELHVLCLLEVLFFSWFASYASILSMLSKPEIKELCIINFSEKNTASLIMIR